MVALQNGDRLGDYVIDSRVGKGRTGSVYLGRQADKLNVEVAIKYPAGGREINTLRGLQGCLGVPCVHSFGHHEDSMWVAMELLGPSLSVVLRTLWLCTSHEQRWQGACIIGRLLLRRIRVIHKNGFMHGDIKPDNVVIGRRKGSADKTSYPYLIDYGLARELSDDSPVEGHIGTVEYSSINSMDGGPRVRHDDVEALGWVLLYGMVGDLPWFELIHEVEWSDKPARTAMLLEVRQAKQDLLGDGPESLNAKYKGLPPALPEFLRLCSRSVGRGAVPDYEKLARLLGCWGIDGDEDDFEDLALFHRFYEGGNSALPEAPHRHDTYYIAGNWTNWACEEMTRHPVLPDVFLFECHLTRNDCKFQIVLNKDWSQVFHPKASKAGNNAGVAGPSESGHGFNWLIGSKVGTVVEIEFHRAPDHKSTLSKVCWKELRYEGLPQNPFRSKTYFIVGTWDKWVQKREMRWNGKCFSICVALGIKLLESFQILVDGDWSQKLHPNVKRANPHEPHQLVGPSKGGHGRNWTIGHHPQDKPAFGAQYVIRLLVGETGLKGVDWLRLH